MQTARTTLRWLVMLFATFTLVIAGCTFVGQTDIPATPTATPAPTSTSAAVASAPGGPARPVVPAPGDPARPVVPAPGDPSMPATPTSTSVPETPPAIDLLLAFIQPVPVSAVSAIASCGAEIAYVPFTVNTETPLRESLQRLIDTPAPDGLQNRLYTVKLVIQDINLANGHADVYLAGQLITSGICDDVIIAEQLYATATQFPTVNTVSFFLNGEPLPVHPSLDETSPTVEELGNITGELGYPSEGVPALDVYAININNPDIFYHITTMPGETTFNFVGVLPDDYYVQAYVAGSDGTFVGTYTYAVPCGLTAECTDHTRIPVTVFPNNTSGGVQIFDWFVPQDTHLIPPVGEPQPLR